MVSDNRVGLIGGTSFVGERLRSLLEEKGYQTSVFSRQGGKDTLSLRVVAQNHAVPIENWFYVAPVWTLPEHFQFLENHGVKRLVALSSTSRLSKVSSPSPSDRALAARLIEGEEQSKEWARLRGCTLVILQPTLIYGLGKDKNVTAIAKVIRRFGFFPLLGQGTGLRRPVHVDDVACACHSALYVSTGKQCTYVLSGQEALPYRMMVERIFAGLGRKPRFIRCPLMAFSLAVRLSNLLPPFKGLTMEIAVRMNKDQDFDHTEAGVDLGFKPRAFHPQRYDLVS